MLEDSRSPAALSAAALALLLPFAAPAADELLDTLARKGVLSAREYDALQRQRQSELHVDTTDGFKLVGGDGAFLLQPGTLQQIDFAWYDADRADLADGTEARRSRLSASGSFLKDWQYRVEYEFSGTTGVTDTYVTYSGYKPLLVTLGQFKQPFGMEALSADKNGTFMERGLPFAFVITRAPGLTIGRSAVNWCAQGGVFGEPLGSVQAGDEGYAVAGRATWAPLLSDRRVVHLGLGLMLRAPTDDNSTNTSGAKFPTARFRSKPESDILAQRFVDTGEIRDVDHYTIVGAELAGALGAASLQAEYQAVQVEREDAKALDFSGWYAQVAYTLSGEVRPYKGSRGFFDGIRPQQPFGPDGWGALEVAVRISAIDLADAEVDGGRMQDGTAALNWYPNAFVRASANLVKVLDVDGGAFDGDEPTIFQLRLQLAI